ncbi:MAG TPA: hypothetical protein VM925_37395 [Labilithrix sp.]|nr:hypothetical protein [Labilithrix sp.]
MALLRSCLAGALLLVVGACSNDDEDFSEQYKISELNASYGAFAHEERLRVYAALLGPKGFVRLRGGDTIEIEIDGVRVSTTERMLDGRVNYVADVPAPPGESEVAITFVRGVERVVGKIKLYSAFNVVAPPATLPRTGSVDIDVDPRPDLSKWPGFFGPSLVAKAEVLGDCLETGAQRIDLCAKDSPAGKCTQGYPLKLDAATLIPSTTKGCQLAVQVRLMSGAKPFEGTGPAKESFKGGGFEGYRLRSFTTQLLE